MARYYSINGANTTASTTTLTTVVQVCGVATARTGVMDITMGSAIAPADYATTWALARCTVGSTVTSFTPLILDPGSGTSIASLAPGGANLTGANGSAEGTISTPVLFTIPLNARATFRYVASPGAEFFNTLAAANGLTLRQSGTTAIVGTATMIWFE